MRAKRNRPNGGKLPDPRCCRRLTPAQCMGVPMSECRGYDDGYVEPVRARGAMAALQAEANAQVRITIGTSKAVFAPPLAKK